MISLALQDAIASPNMGVGRLQSDRKTRFFYTRIAQATRYAKQDVFQRSPKDTILKGEEVC